MSPVQSYIIPEDDRIIRSPGLSEPEWKELIEKVKQLEIVRDLDQPQSQ